MTVRERLKSGRLVAYHLGEFGEWKWKWHSRWRAVEVLRSNSRWGVAAGFGACHVGFNLYRYQVRFWWPWRWKPEKKEK